MPISMSTNILFTKIPTHLGMTTVYLQRCALILDRGRKRALLLPLDADARAPFSMIRGVDPGENIGNLHIRLFIRIPFIKTPRLKSQKKSKH